MLFLFTSSPPFGCKVTFFDGVVVVTTGALSSLTFAFMLKSSQFFVVLLFVFDFVLFVYVCAIFGACSCGYIIYFACLSQSLNSYLTFMLCKRVSEWVIESNCIRFFLFLLCFRLKCRRKDEYWHSNKKNNNKSWKEGYSFKMRSLRVGVEHKKHINLFTDSRLEMTTTIE